jgi:hypothetical protein
MLLAKCSVETAIEDQENIGFSSKTGQGNSLALKIL